MKKTLIISGQFTSLSGYGRKSYDIAKSFIEIYEKEFDIRLIPFKWGGTKNDFIDENDDLIKYFIPQITFRPDVYIHIGLPNELNPIGIEKNILFTSGIETDIAPQNFVEGCNKADVVIVPSTFVRDVLLNTVYQSKDGNGNVLHEFKITKPIEVLFEGYNENVFKEISYTENNVYLKDIQESFCYLFVGTWLDGDIGQDRKDVGMLVKVFLEVFKNKLNRPALILKTSGVTTSIMDRDKIQEKINKIKETVDSKNLPNIYLIHGDLTDAEMNSLYNNSKVKAMVSFTKGEGFSRTFLEFAATNKLLIVPTYSGHMDFVKKDYNILLGGTLNEIHPSVVNDFLIKGSKWFTVNYNEAAGILQEVHKNSKKYLDMSKKQSSFVSKNFTLTKMKEKLKTIIDEYVPREVLLKLPSFVQNKKLKLNNE